MDNRRLHDNAAPDRMAGRCVFALLGRLLFGKERAAMPAQELNPLAEIGLRALEVLTKTADA